MPESVHPTAAGPTPADRTPADRHLQRVGSGVFELAEGPVWDARRGRALWVDIDGCAAWAWKHPDGTEPTALYRAEREVCAVLPADDGGLLVVEANRLVHVDASGAVLAARDGGLPATRRFNDATVDPQGRLVVGTLNRGDDATGEELFRLEVDGRLRRLRGGLSLSNGIGFSPDGAVMYHVDTLRRRIDLLDATADIPAVTASWEIEGGYPDGLAVDVDGCVWVALWGGSAVVRLDPEGVVTDRIDTPAPHTSSVAFIGPRLDELLITTARADREEPADPEGGVYRAGVDVPGAAVPEWRTIALR